MTLALCACSETVWVTGRRQPSEASVGEHRTGHGSANPGLQAARDNMYEWEGRVRARVWIDDGVKISSMEMQKKREKKSGSKQQ